MYGRGDSNCASVGAYRYRISVAAPLRTVIPVPTSCVIANAAGAEV
jgi:hypothetical protein